MAKSKVADLGRDKITVREMTVGEIKELFDQVEESATDGIMNMLTTSTTAKVDQLLGVAPSEMNDLIEKLVEVNSDFLDQCRRVNNTALAESFEGLLRQVSLIAFMQ